jgi:hypothetical protein
MAMRLTLRLGLLSMVLVVAVSAAGCSGPVRRPTAVAVTAKVGPDDTYVAQPGDVLYVVEVTIRPESR